MLVETKQVICSQRSPEWYSARLGIPSASGFSQIITSKGLPSQSKYKYLMQLAQEIVTGKQEDTFQSAAMRNGIAREHKARFLYEQLVGVKVTETGFHIKQGLNYKCGASPDGLVEVDGLVEIKCPQVNTHFDYLFNTDMPAKYKPQVQGQLFVTGRQWCDFMSYYPGTKPFIIRVERDEVFIKKLEKELIKFYSELQFTVSSLSNLIQKVN